MKLTIPLHLGQRLRRGGILLLLSLYVFIVLRATAIPFVWQRISASKSVSIMTTFTVKTVYSCRRREKFRMKILLPSLGSQ